MGGHGARRPFAAMVVAVTVLVAVVVWAPTPARMAGLPPNVIVVVTDDQPVDSMAGDPAAMPWLRAQLDDPEAGWISYTNAVVSTPMCCPSRASILTGLPSWTTGVTDNETGWRLDEDHTLAVWLHDAGYRTAMVGKYLNGYPWDRGPYVPPGWDRWFAKTNDSIETTYTGYGVIDQTTPRRLGTRPEDYVTDVLGAEALSFVRGAPADEPWFLYLAPPAPHAPFMPAPRHEGVFDGVALPSVASNDVAGKPAWLRARPPIDAERRAELDRDRLDGRETLLAVDEVLRALSETVEARGETDRTVIVVTSDNGFAFGEHRWVGKQVPYEPSIRVPLMILVPGAATGPIDELASNLDLAPTIAALAGAHPTTVTYGRDLLGAPPPGWVPIAWAGSPDVPPWWGVRTADAVYIRWSTGEEELYLLGADPDQHRNLASDPRYAGVVDASRAMLRVGSPEGRG